MLENLTEKKTFFSTKSNMIYTLIEVFFNEEGLINNNVGNTL